MAYLSNPLDDELEKKNAEGTQNTSGVVGSSTGAANGTGGPVVDTQAPTSTGFVNLQKYLDANQGAGGKMAGDATKDLAASADTYKNDAATTVDSASKDFSGASGDQDANRINQGINSNNNSVYSDAKNFLGVKYSGPQAQDYTSNLKANADSVKGNLGQVDDANFQQDLLKKAYGGGGNYNSSFGALDSFLINGDQSGRDALAGVKAKANDVGAAYDDASSKINQGEAAARAKLTANQQSIRDTAKKSEDAKVAYVNSEIAKKNATLNKDYLGTHAATAGDVLTNQSRLDLQALADLAGDQRDARWDEAAAFKAGQARPVAPPPPAPEATPEQQARNGDFNPFGVATPVPGAVAKAGNDVAQSPKQNQAQPIVAPTSKAAPTVAEKVVNTVADNIPTKIPTKAPSLKRPKYKGPH